MTKKGGTPKLANCSPEEVIKAFHKIGNFRDKGGRKHAKMEHVGTNYCTEIPRHSRIKRGLMIKIVNKFLIDKCGFTEEEIYKHLWC